MARAVQFARAESGSATLEFVIFFPLIFAIGVMIFVFSFYVATASEVQQVAHELARSSFRIVNVGAGGDLCTKMDTDVLPTVVSHMSLIDAADFHPMAACPSQPSASGMVTVSVTYDLSTSSIHNLGKLLGFDLDTIVRSSTVQL